MSTALIELTQEQVIGFNKKVIEDAHQKNPHCQQKHLVRSPGGVSGCLGGIFYQGFGTYQNLPIEKMAGLLLYRIAEGQYFMDGNKRTALLSSYFFLFNNGYLLRFTRTEMNSLIWGFAADPNNPTAPRKYKEEDAVQFVMDRTFLRP